MTADNDVVDVFLQPGEYYFGGADTRIRTLLGSCVAIVMWHPVRRIGGMSHSILPSREANGSPVLDSRYVDDALLCLIREAVAECTKPNDYQIKLFGGGDMFSSLGVDNPVEIGRMNATKAIQMLDALDLPLAAHDLGGEVHRSLVFEIDSGAVWVRRGAAGCIG